MMLTSREDPAAQAAARTAMATRLALIGEGDLSHGALARRLALALGEESVDVRLSVIEQPSGLEAQLIRGLPLVGDVDLQPLRWRLRFSWRARQALESAAASSQAALVNTQSCALLAGSLMQRVPTILSVDITGRQFARMEYWRRRSRFAVVNDGPLEALERRAFRRAARIVAWSEWTARSLREDYGIDEDRIVVMHYGVDLAAFAPRAGERRAGPLRALFVGNGAHRKGLDVLVGAMREIDDGVELAVVTNDEDVPAVRGITVFKGVQPESEALHAYLREADVLVLPSRADAVPWVVIEALASGLPVIGSDVGAIPELIDGAGIVVPVADAAAVAAALRRLAGDATVRTRLGRQARERAESRFDQTVQARRLAELIRSIATLHPRG